MADGGYEQFILIINIAIQDNFIIQSNVNIPEIFVVESVLSTDSSLWIEFKHSLKELDSFLRYGRNQVT